MGRISAGIAEYSSTARLAVAGFWVAWITIIYSGDCIVVPISSPYATTSSAFMFSTFALGALLFAAACAPAPFERLLANRRALLCCGAAAALATVGVAFEGAVPFPLFVTSAVASGALTGLMALAGGVVYAEVDTKRGIIANCLSVTLGVLVYALASMCAAYFPPVVVLCITAPLPVMGLWLATLPSPVPAPIGDEAARTLQPSFWRVIVFCGLLIFAMSMVRGYYPQLLDSADFSMSRGVVALGLVVVNLVVLCLAARMPRSGMFGRFFYWLLVVPVVAIVPIAFLGLASPLAGALGGVANGVVCLAAWCLFTGISYHSGVSPVRTMGFGYGTVGVTMAGGFVVGAFFGGVIDERYAMVVGTAFLLACVALALLLLRAGDLDKFTAPTQALLQTMQPHGEDDRPAPPGGLEAPDARGQGVEADPAQRAALDDGGPGDAGGPDAHKPGKFLQKCHLVAEAHGLSERETDVFLLLAKRMDAKSIAGELFVSFNTVRTHISRIYAKLGVHSRRELLELIDSYRID